MKQYARGELPPMVLGQPTLHRAPAIFRNNPDVNRQGLRRTSVQLQLSSSFQHPFVCFDLPF